jgi:lipopolysaccharide export system permease protein
MRWLVLVGTAFTIVIILFDFMELIRKTSGKSFMGFALIIQMILLKLPGLVEQLLPFILLFSAILTFWYLNRHHELEVMRAAGVSILQLLKPMILCAVVLGGIDLTIINPISSGMMLRYEHLHDRYFKGHRGSLAVSESGLWLREVENTIQTVFHVQNVNAEEKKLINVSIFQSDLRDRFLRRLDAKQALFDNNKIKLSQVWISAPEQIPEFIDQYELATSLTFTSLQNRGADPQSLSFWSIPQYVELLERSGLSGLKYQLHWHFLIARVAWLGVMIILAASCALRPIRQGRTFLMIAIGIAAAFLLYFLRDVTFALGSSAKIPVLMAAWAPVLISGSLSIAVLLHLEES